MGNGHSERNIRAAKEAEEAGVRRALEHQEHAQRMHDLAEGWLYFKHIASLIIVRFPIRATALWLILWLGLGEKIGLELNWLESYGLVLAIYFATGLNNRPLRGL